MVGENLSSHDRGVGEASIELGFNARHGAGELIHGNRVSRCNRVGWTNVVVVAFSAPRFAADLS